MPKTKKKLHLDEIPPFEISKGRFAETPDTGRNFWRNVDEGGINADFHGDLPEAVITPNNKATYKNSDSYKFGQLNAAQTGFNIAAMPFNFTPGWPAISAINTYFNLGKNMAYPNFYSNKDAALDTGLEWLLPSIGGRIGKIAKNIRNRNAIMYNTVSPIGYSSPSKRLKLYLRNLISSNPPTNIYEKPVFNRQLRTRLDANGETNVGTYLLPHVKAYMGDKRFIENLNWLDYLARQKTKVNELSDIFRDEAYRLHLQLPARYPIYKYNRATRAYDYDISEIKKLYDAYNVSTNHMDLSTITHRKPLDWLTGNGGGTEPQRISLIGNNKGFVHMKDTWDIQPFQRIRKDAVSSLLAPKADALYKFLYPYIFKIGTKRSKVFYPIFGKPLQKIRGGESNTINGIDNYLQNHFNKIKNLEVSSVMGGKPFTLDTEIPVTFRRNNNGEIDLTDVILGH